MFKHRLQELLSGNLVRSVAIVATGTAGAQTIGLVFVPFITRTYGPEVYGEFGAFLA